MLETQNDKELNWRKTKQVSELSPNYTTHYIVLVMLNGYDNDIFKDAESLNQHQGSGFSNTQKGI